MKRLMTATGIAVLAVVALVGPTLAAGPYGGARGAGDRERLRDTSTVSEVLGLSHEQVMALRQDGLSLAQVAERQGVDPETLVDRLTEHARERIAARVVNGALEPEEAAQLQVQLEERVRARVADPAPGGIGGVLGARQRGAGRGPGARTDAPVGPNGNRDCDGNGAQRRGGR